jgi:hypothetical protein
MFIENADTTALRQGDIIRGVYFPLLRMDAPPRVVGTFAAGSGERVDLKAVTEQIGRSWYLLVQTHAVMSFCAVLSQDCDVDLKQSPPPPSFVLCRLIPVPEPIKRKEFLYGALKGNLDPYGDQRPFFQLFYIGRAVGLDEEYVADYGQVMTVAWRDYNAALRNKILQMDDVSRAKFRVKAGAHFGRATEEDRIAGREDPWGKEPRESRILGALPQRLVRACRIVFGKE